MTCPQSFGSCLLLVILLTWSPAHGNSPPTFDNVASDGSTHITVSEETALDDTIFTLSASDTEGDTLTYGLIVSPSHFKLSGQDIDVAATLDYETVKTYSLEVTVNDGTNSVTATITVTITNVNDETPTITAASYIASIAENQSPGTVVPFSLTVVDADAADTTLGEKLTYSLEGIDSSSFVINSLTGQITTALRLDRESKDTYDQLVIKVQDAASPSAHTATASLTVSVTDLNDVTPSCSPAVYYVTVAENTAQSGSLATLTCSDTDLSQNGYNTITYTIASGDPGNVFQMSASQLQTGATAIDYETHQLYTLVIHVADSPTSGSANTGTVTVLVTVIGVNEYDPTWTAAPVDTSIAEDWAVGDTIIAITASDNDKGSDGTVDYSIINIVDEGGNAVAGIFRMDAVSGVLSTLQALDREGGVTSYTITLKAEDKGSPARSVTSSVSITITDVNDNDPVFTSSGYSKTLGESSATAGASLVLVSASDLDQSPVFTYSVGSVLVGNPPGTFEFDASLAGLFKLATAIDLENHGYAYSLVRILVTDGGTPIRTGTATVTVSVFATNDYDPQFVTVPSGTVTVSEADPPGSLVAVVSATDQDIGSDGVVTLSITGGNTGNAFTILSNGEIRTLSTLDFDGGTRSYDLVVTATDGGSTRRSASTTISIAISNANDNPPVCTSTLITVTLPETATTNTVVATPSCSDADGNSLTFTFVSGNADSKFALSSSSGQITLANTVDYDSGTKSYILQVSVTDGTNAQTLTVNVNISPVNDATPTFTSSPTVTVSESEAAGYVVTTYTATDSDLAPHAITQYAITAVTQGGSSLFSIDRSSGTIRLLAPLDYDALPAGSKQYVVTVTATDGGGLVGTGSVTVDVSDVNDNAPVCSQSSRSSTILESVSSFPSVVINSLGCLDTEDGTSLTYTLNQSPGSMFSVVSGRIEQDAAVDYESSPLHVLSVVVADSGTPSLSTTVIVNIIVQNVNEGPPVFGGPYTATKAENVAIGTSVAQLVATDPDGVTNSYGNPQYSILSGDPNGQFNIDSSTGLVTTRAALDAETAASYSLVVQALEKGGANSATATLTVSVTDVNDVTPSCTVSTFARTVSEAAATGSTILTLTCTDGDVTPTTLTYGLASGDASLFAMTSGALTLSAPLDYDAGTTKYDVTIRVSDGVHSAYVVGSVSVGAVNEFDPVFSQTTYTAYVSESFSVGGTVMTVTATDGDSSSTADGVVTYGFVSSSSTFAIVSSSGTIVLSSSLDRELVATYTLLVTARDIATTVTATVSIIINDANDNPPVFTSALYTASVPETATSPATVVTVSASDADDPATSNNGVVIYSITAGNTNGHFTIGSSTGIITTTTQLNAASISSYILTVTAKDRNGASGALSATCLVTVTVTAVNQYDPVFTSSTYSYTVAENTAVGTELVQVSATDADSGSGGVVTYSMTSHIKFLLSADGWISVKAALDHETTPTAYTFDVIASDQGSPQRSATATVSITIGDVNDNTALCALSVVSVQKREDYTGTITTLTCTDADAGGNAALTYAIHSVDGVAGGGGGSFSVSSAGVVIVSQLDYEGAASHEVVVVVADGGSPPRSTSVLVVVTVSDVNEYNPTFSSTPFSANIGENEALGTTVLRVTASDNDGSDTVTYSLSDTTYLEVSALTGDITLKARLDYETTHAYSVDVCATDSNAVDARRTACETISITVTDANDNDPIFSPSVYVASVDENTSAGTTVVTVTATDRDVLVAGGTVSYAIASGNTGSVFRVDLTAGHVIIDDNTGLDYEAVRGFTLVVAASDGGGRSAQAVVTITVNPRNEATPTFSPASSTISMAENAAVGFSVATITATDADSGPDGQLTYSIAAGALGKFAIASASGEVTLVASLDRETTQLYVLRVEAVDGGTSNPSAKTGTYSLTIDVTDVNDVIPACTHAYYSAAVSEDAAVGSAVTTLTCSDGDLDPSNLNNALTYTITGGNAAGHFAVGASGAVTVSAASLDRESTSSYILTIEVADRAASGKLTTSVTVNVDITDVNDNMPIFTSNPYTLVAVAENSAVGYTVGAVSAADQDAGSNAAITYSLVSASVAGKFAVDASTGVVTVAAALDYETTTSYTLVVSATDRGSVPLSSSATVSIPVSNVNDNPPICVASMYTATLPENADPATAVVVTVSCPDADTPLVTYSLTDAKFAVHPSTGVVSLISALNCESAQAHTLTITASDGIYTATTIVEVTVTDVNEFAPVFAPTTPYTASVSEDSPAGYTVKDVDASDADVTDNVLTYSITSGNAAGKFTVDSATGVIQVLGSLDRETTSSYSLTLEVADGSGVDSRTSTTSLIITITDVNDNDPACSPASYVASVNEDVAVSTTVVALTCSDADAGVTLAYTLLTPGNTGSAFAIDSSSGEITVATALDYETLKAYALRVEVSDQSTPSARTTTVPVNVAVQPTNEFDPTFPATGYGNTDVSESTPVGTVILTVTATDADVGLLQGTVRYSIVSGNSLGHFAIDSASGDIKVAKALDRETTASYSLAIKAEDEFTGSPTLRSGVTTVGVTVSDVNDNYPVFNPTLYSVTVLETAPTGGTVATVTVSDDDAGTNAVLTVSIVSGNTGNAFSISGSHVILNANLDYETTSSYELILRAADQGTPTLTAQAMVVVTVGAVNEQAPLLTDTTVTLTISEATPIGTLIYTASALDSDKGGNNDGTVTYSIISGDTTPNSFYIGSTNGKVLVLSTLDYDTHPQAYTLTVEARDGGGLTDTVQLQITLLDENDNTPQFTRNTYTSTLNENVSLGTTVLTVTATDLDSGSNGQVSYSITGFNGPNAFTIDSATGTITTTGIIDYESLHVRYLVVKAVDAGATPLSSTCLVRITIVDLNDNSPVIVPDDFAVTVAEDATIGTQVAAVAATDADSSANNNNVVVFGLSSTHFHVHPNTGDITTVATLDRETTPSFILLVTATDQGTDPHQNTVTSTVTVSLLDVNDNTPIISGTYDQTVSEDTGVNTIVVTVVATDADAGDNARLTYTITSGNTNNDFKIISSTGMLQVAKPLDRETTTMYHLQVTVSDNAATAPRSSSATVILTISDVNDNDPVFSGLPYSFYVAENSNAGVTIGRLAASDADEGQNANLLFSFVTFWTGGSSYFTLNAATGRITTAVTTLDRETQASYLVRCRVWDQGSPQRFADVNVSITITDVNDNPPVIAAGSYNVSVAENSALMTSVMSVSATDADVGVNAEIAYSIDTSTARGSRANNYLQINGTSGEMSVKSNIDYETDHSFVFVVVASDGGSPTFSDTTTVTVNVVDKNDNAPVFTSTFINTEVAYAGQCSSAIATLTCTDADSGVNAQTLCYFSSNGYGSLFSIDGNACAVELNSIAASNTRYLLEVQCRDSGSPLQIAASHATVRVDTFIPDKVAIRFSLSISRSSFLAQQSTFTANVQTLVRGLFPNAMVRLWCIQEREGTASSPSTGRRRLLADQPVDVLVYATQDNTTNSYANTGQNKAFVSSSQLVSIFASDATGTPSSAVSGSGWDYFGVEAVMEYAETSTPWIETTEGIVVVTVCCVLALALLVLLIVMCLRCCSRRRRPVTPVRAMIAEAKSQPVRDKPLITGSEYDSGLRQRSEKPYTKKSVTRAEVSGDPVFVDTGRRPAGRRPTQDSLTSRSLPFASPRGVVLSSKNQTDVYPVVNRDFDGRALDPKTGRIYEYSTKTNKRRWLEPPPPYQQS